LTEELDEVMTTPRLLSDRYELGETLGSGGMSEVRRGRDGRLGREVAVKVLRAELARDSGFRLRFRREAQNAAALNHPAIVAVYDTGETRTDEGPLPYIVMEFVDGRTLRDVVRTEGPMPARRAMEIMADACAALDFSHRNGIVHRDVKPANVMITGTGAVKVMDFGIARALADEQRLTQTAAVIGTAHYLSPEQARGEMVDGRSDVYSAGCVLYELVTGQPPFTGDSPVAVAYQHVEQAPRPPSALNPLISPVLDAVVLKAMSKNPADRYQSAGGMRADLVRVLSGQPSAPPMAMTDAERTTPLGATADTDLAPDEQWPEAPTAERDDRGSPKGVIVAAALLGVGLLALAALVVANGSGNTAPRAVSVPNVVGQQRAQAETAIANAGLRAAVVEVTSTVAQVGRVASTEPRAGSQVAERSTVTLNVGKGPNRVTVPALSGKTVEEAKTLLERAGLTLAATQDRRVVNDARLVGKIIGQQPAGNARVAPNTAVRVAVGIARRRPAPPEQVNLINVVGQTRSTATSNLEAIGLVVNVEEVDHTAPRDEVVAQNPKSGKLNKGATVTISVSRGNQIAMPDIHGLTVAEAQDTLQRLGWTGLLEQTPVPTADPNQDGKILDQQPNTDQPLSRDQAVHIQIGQLTATSTTPPTPIT
jgi:serine/threonine-protein kinase